MYKKLFRELGIYILTGLLIWYCIILISGGVSVQSGIVNAVDRCLNVIIPSLFAFMAASQILISGGFYYYVSLPFYPLSRFLLRIPTGFFFVFLLGNLAGYPIGIKLLSDMVEGGKISKRTAEKMSCYCYCGGPAFYAGAVGLAVFRCTGAGIAVFLSIVAANLIIGIAMGFFGRGKEVCGKPKVCFKAEILTDSVISAGKSLFVICVFIVFFSTVMSAFDYYDIFDKIKTVFGISDNAVTLIKSCLEISCVTELEGSPFKLLPHIAGICSFGGLCVIIQVIAISGRRISLTPFLLSRIPAAFLTAVICRLIYPSFIPDSLEASASETVTFGIMNNFIPSICLIMMILLLILKKRLAFSKTV